MIKAAVCIVDDDPSVQRALRRLLQSAGYCVLTCNAAEEFLAMTALPRPICLLLDLRMPGMTGADLQAAIVGTKHDVPVIMFSGHADAGTIMRSKLAGAVSCLSKPVEEDELLRTVAFAIAIDRRRLAALIPTPAQVKG